MPTQSLSAGHQPQDHLFAVVSIATAVLVQLRRRVAAAVLLAADSPRLVLQLADVVKTTRSVEVRMMPGGVAPVLGSAIQQFVGIDLHRRRSVIEPPREGVSRTRRLQSNLRTRTAPTRSLPGWHEVRGLGSPSPPVTRRQAGGSVGSGLQLSEVG